MDRAGARGQDEQVRTRAASGPGPAGHYEPAREELADVSGRNPRAKAPPDDLTNAGRRAVRRLLLRRADRRAVPLAMRGDRKREGVPRADINNRGGGALATRAV